MSNRRELIDRAALVAEILRHTSPETSGRNATAELIYRTGSPQAAAEAMLAALVLLTIDECHADHQHNGSSD